MCLTVGRSSETCDGGRCWMGFLANVLNLLCNMQVMFWIPQCSEILGPIKWF